VAYFGETEQWNIHVITMTIPIQSSNPSGENITLTTINRERKERRDGYRVNTCGGTSGRRFFNSDSLKILIANSKLDDMYPNYGRNGNL